MKKNFLVSLLGTDIGTAEEWDGDAVQAQYMDFDMAPAFLSAISHTAEQAKPALGHYSVLALNYETGEFQLFISSSDEKPAFTGKLRPQGVAT